MLSSVKNFILTFILAAVIFGIIAALVLGVVINNINGVIGNGQTSSSGISKPIEDERPENERDRKKLNILVIGSDYRSGIYGDYDPTVLKSLFGIVQKKIVEPAAPRDTMSPAYDKALSLISDKGVGESGYTVTDDGQIVIDGGFYQIEFRPVRADIATVVSFDFERNIVEYYPIDTDKEIAVVGGKISLGNVLNKYGVDSLIDAIVQEYDINVDKYILVSAENFENLYNIYGEIDYLIPMDMKQDDYLGDIHIDLLQGSRTLTSSEALDLLMFSEYGDSRYSRKAVAQEFIAKFVNNAFSSSNLKNTAANFNKAKAYVTTNLTAEDFTSRLGQISKCITD